MQTVLLIFHIVACMALILIVLLQTGRGAEMGAAFGGSSQTLFGSTGGSTFMGKLTTMAAIGFMLTCLGLTYFSGRPSTESVMEDVKVPERTGPAIPDAKPVDPSASSPAPAAQSKPVAIPEPSKATSPSEASKPAATAEPAPAKATSAKPQPVPVSKSESAVPAGESKPAASSEAPSAAPPSGESKPAAQAPQQPVSVPSAGAQGNASPTTGETPQNAPASNQ